MIVLGGIIAGHTAWSELVCGGAPGESRTHTGRVLNLTGNLGLTCANSPIRGIWGAKRQQPAVRPGQTVKVVGYGY
jgi:hypothetical protein